jgi:hypothetical protein
MKTPAIWAIATLLTAAAGVHGSCLASEKAPPGAHNIIGILAGSAVSIAELGGQHARGSTNINVNNTKVDAANATGGDGAAFENGFLHGNSVSGTSTTGMITTTNSVNNNMGITTVFQNSGNNSLFQQSTAITINLTP